MADDIQENNGGFNYCFWGKLFVAIPALPIAALVSSSFVQGYYIKITVAVITVCVLVYAAIKIDQIPMFSKKLFTRRK